MINRLVMSLFVLSLLVAALAFGMILKFGNLKLNEAEKPAAVQTTSTQTVASATIPPYTPLPSLTPSQTLLPPPTFAPPTQTPVPSFTPSTTPTPTVDYSVSIPGLHGAETPTPSTTPGCQVNKDWNLIYEVKVNDTLSSIASMYGTYPDDLALNNCLTDANLITVGQQLHVPGSAQPQPTVDCPPWEALTPFNGSMNIPTMGQITFNWRGPNGVRNLLRVRRPDGSLFERVIELRQNETVDIAENFRLGGTYSWYIYPLDFNFRQIACLEGGPWIFTKPETVIVE
jgi:LysM repeat protein